MSEVKRLSNLGYSVSTSIISYEQAVREAEGSRWDLPFAIYFFGSDEDRVFVSYNLAVTGPNPNIEPEPSAYDNRITMFDYNRITMDGKLRITQ